MALNEAGEATACFPDESFYYRKGYEWSEIFTDQCGEVGCTTTENLQHCVLRCIYYNYNFAR